MGRIVNNQKDTKPMKLMEDQIKKIFKKYDVNNDNQLSKEELKKPFIT